MVFIEVVSFLRTLSDSGSHPHLPALSEPHSRGAQAGSAASPLTVFLPYRPTAALIFL